MNTIVITVPITLVSLPDSQYPNNCIEHQNGRTALKALNIQYGYEDGIVNKWIDGQGLVDKHALSSGAHIEATHNLISNHFVTLECEVTRDGRLIPKKLL